MTKTLSEVKRQAIEYLKLSRRLELPENMGKGMNMSDTLAGVQHILRPYMQVHREALQPYWNLTVVIGRRRRLQYRMRFVPTTRQLYRAKLLNQATRELYERCCAVKAAEGKAAAAAAKAGVT